MNTEACKAPMSAPEKRFHGGTSTGSRRDSASANSVSAPRQAGPKLNRMASVGGNSLGFSLSRTIAMIVAVLQDFT